MPLPPGRASLPSVGDETSAFCSLLDNRCQSPPVLPMNRRLPTNRLPTNRPPLNRAPANSASANGAPGNGAPATSLSAKQPTTRRSRAATALLATLAAALALALAGPAAGGTWKWRDASGHIVYSDLPPPPGLRITAVSASDHGAPADVPSPTGPAQQGVPALEGPAVTPTENATTMVAPRADRNGASARSTSASPTRAGAGDAQGAAPTPAAGAAIPGGWVEREKAARQQAAARANAEQVRVEEKRQAAESERACTGATASLRTLESGLRLAAVNSRGVPEVIDQLERARRIDANRRMLAEHCGARG